jgi:hypothetical protein
LVKEHPCIKAARLSTLLIQNHSTIRSITHVSQVR